MAIPESFLAFGYVVARPAEDVLKLLPIAAHEQDRVPEARQRDLLDNPDARDPDYQITQVDLHVQALPANPEKQCILASSLYTADASDLQWIDDDDLPIDDEDQTPLDWALGVLGLDRQELPSEWDNDGPRWHLGLGSRSPGMSS